jgi:polyisoprenyl-phosphate glycosyltransferase
LPAWHEAARGAIPAGQAAEEDEHMDENAVEDVAFSFVCIVQNNADRLRPCYDRIKETADGLGQKYEIIFINDGSTDASMETIRTLANMDGSVKYADFSRSFGRPAAMAAGFDCAGGHAVITLSGDGTAVACVPQLIERWQGGAEVAYTTSDPAAGAEAADRAAVCLLDRKVVAAVRYVRGASRGQRGLLEWIGFKTAAVQFKDGSIGEPPRQASVWQSIAGVLHAANSPLRIMARAGAVMLLAGATCLAAGVVPAWRGAGGIWWMSAVILIVGGAQLWGAAAVAQWVIEALRPVEDHFAYVVRFAHGFQVEQGPEAPEAPAPKLEKAARFNVMT